MKIKRPNTHSSSRFKCSEVKDLVLLKDNHFLFFFCAIISLADTIQITTWQDDQRNTRATRLRALTGQYLQSTVDDAQVGVVVHPQPLGLHRVVGTHPRVGCLTVHHTWPGTVVKTVAGPSIVQLCLVRAAPSLVTGKSPVTRYALPSAASK